MQTDESSFTLTKIERLIFDIDNRILVASGSEKSTLEYIAARLVDIRNEEKRLRFAERYGRGAECLES